MSLLLRDQKLLSGKCESVSVMLSHFQVILTSQTCHRSLDRTRKTSLEVQESHPYRSNSNTNHLKRHSTHLLHPGPSLLLTEVPLCGNSILSRYSVHDLNSSNTSDEQHFMWPLVSVDGQRYLWVLCKHHHLWRFGWCAKNNFLTLPVKPDRDHPRCPILPGVCQPCRNSRMEQLLCNWVVK